MPKPKCVTSAIWVQCSTVFVGRTRCDISLFSFKAQSSLMSNFPTLNAIKAKDKYISRQRKFIIDFIQFGGSEKSCFTCGCVLIISTLAFTFNFVVNNVFCIFSFFTVIVPNCTILRIIKCVIVTTGFNETWLDLFILYSRESK